MTANTVRKSAINMDSLTRQRYFALVALSVSLALVFIEDFDSYGIDFGYWLDVILATVCVYAAAITVFVAWEDTPSHQRGYFFLFVLMCAFWLVVWFWYADDFCSDYWGTVFLNAAYCASLCTAFYWLDRWRPRAARPYVICLGVGLAATCLVLMWRGHCAVFRDFEYGVYYFIPSVTVSVAACLAVLWALVRVGLSEPPPADEKG